MHEPFATPGELIDGIPSMSWCDPHSFIRGPRATVPVSRFGLSLE